MSSEETRIRENGPKFTSALMAGALSGLTVDLLFYPIDTIKTRLQSSSGFLASGGFKGVYRGLGSVAVGSAPGAATFFVTYESLKPALLKHFPDFFGGDGMGKHGLHMVASSIGEVVACLIRVPTEVIKSRQQTSTYGASVSSAEAFKAVFRESGIKGYYRGYGGTVGREIPFTCIQFPLYEHLKRQIFTSTYFGHEPISSTLDTLGSSSLIEKERRRKVRELPTWQAGLAGSVAGAVAAGLTTPLDVVKTRIMLERRTILPDPIAKQTEITATTTTTSSTTTRTIKESVAKPKGVNHRMIPTLLHIIRTEPLRNLFAGFIPRTLWIGFGGAVFLGTFDKGVKILEEGRVL